MIDLEDISTPRIIPHQDSESGDNWEDDDSGDSWSDDPCDCPECEADREDEEEADHWHTPESETSSTSSLEEEHQSIDTNILRVNRQIYREASALLYSEAEVILGIDDILCVAPHGNKKVASERAFPDFIQMIPPQNRIWRYNPLKPWEQKHSNGEVKYKSSNYTLGGRLEPHVFSRFQKIKFELRFDEDYNLEDEMWIDDDTLVFNQSQAESYKVRMQRSNIIKDFVRIIKHSPLITHLAIVLEAEVEAMSTAIARADDIYEYEDELDADEMSAIEAKAEEIQDKANEIASELLLETNLFDPLYKLSNVKNFKFEFDFMHRDFKLETSKPYQPQPNTSQIIVAMKNRIEGNFNVSKAEPRKRRKRLARG